MLIATAKITTSKCDHCGKFGHVVELDSYKSLLYVCSECLSMLKKKLKDEE